MSKPKNEKQSDGADQIMVGATSRGDYEIGRGRPPKEYQFKKGQSGNPSGRSRKKLDEKTILEQLMAERVTIREDGKERKVTKLDALYRSHMAKAIKGDTRSANFIMDQTARTGVGVEPDSEAPRLRMPNANLSQSDGLFADLDLGLLSEDEQIELARFGNIMDLGGDFTALSLANFARAKELTDKGRGKDVTPRA
jgi:hypothetical protein